MCTAAGIAQKFVAAIDFGTTHCSVAYLIRPDPAPELSKVDPIILTLDNAGNKRIPSCILFDPSGKKIAFGNVARDQYAALDHDERPQHHYFEHVKKHLQHEKDIDRNQIISSLNGKKFFLVDVIAHIFHHLKNQLVSALKDDCKKVKTSDINWVITVPAFWSNKAKEVMREAGHMAGLYSDSKPPPICIATGPHSPPQEEKSPEKLLLVSEPECAAIHCRHKAEVAGKVSQYLVKAEKYLVVDIGGGTVDIASHAIVGGQPKEIAPPAGNFWGGTTVNEKFSEFLQDFVSDPKFSRYIENSSPEIQARHKADLNKLLYKVFESQKKRFGSDEAQDRSIIDFPRSFLKVYEDSLVTYGKDLNLKGDKSVQVKVNGAVMQIYDSRMAEFFQPAIQQISTLIKSHLKANEIADEIDTIFWVGGFGGCKYVCNQLQEAIKAMFPMSQYQFPVPPEPELAVIRGATAFSRDLGI